MARRAIQSAAGFAAALVAVWAAALVPAGCGGESAPEEDGPDGGGSEPTAKEWRVVVDDYADGALLSVWTGPGEEVWIVGGEKGRSIALRYRAGAWKRLDPPAGEQLWWVHGFASGERITVGENGVIGLYAHATWTMQDAGLQAATLYGVWGASTGDVWAVGGPWTRAPPGTETEKPVLIHYDGKTWSRVDVADLLPAHTQSLFKVWGEAADDVWVVGDHGTVLHWDGQAWAAQDSGLTGVVLFTVHGGADDAWAVGGYGAAAMLHRHGDGAWESQDVGEWAPTLQGVRAGPGGEVWVCGWDGYAARLSAGRWQEFQVGTEHALHAINLDSEGRIWTVGGDITTLKDDHVGVIAVRGEGIPAP